MHEDGGKFEPVVKEKITYGLAVDHISKLLYWFEDRKSLLVTTIDGTESKTLYTGLTYPRDIALYEEKGELLLFFCSPFLGTRNSFN